LFKAFKFEEDFQKALEGFSHASLLDPSWNAPEAQEKQLCSYLTSVSQMIEAKVI
jgi:hypothetical protein